MEKRSKRRVPFVMVFLFFFMSLAAIFQRCLSENSQPAIKTKSNQPTAVNRLPSSVVFKVVGSVYPLGYYAALVSIGNPPKTYELDFDTGSDLTWVQCDAPCQACTVARKYQYKPHDNALHCSHPLCHTILPPANLCKAPNDQCDYELKYADGGSSLGALVMDYFPMRVINGTTVRPTLAFGCGYDQKNPSTTHIPTNTAGVLGLGRGLASFVSQLKSQGITRNLVGHCLGGRGGGYLFLGDHYVPSSGLTWMPLLRSSDNYYRLGPADLLYGGKPTDAKGLVLILDSGSSYTYFNSQVYQSIVNLVKNDLNGKPLKNAQRDKSLPICWKGAKRFRSVSDVKSYFKPLVLSFTNARNVVLQLLPENYLIVTKDGNVCFGILNSAENNMGQSNVIGDISFQDKLIIYDNERQQVGWIPADCDRLPNVDRDYNEAFCQPYAAKFGILEEYCPSPYAFKKANELMYN